MTNLRYAAILAAVAFAARLGASEEVLSAASFAFPSVQQAGSARAIGMGSTYVGVAEGSAALIWNPAGLSGLDDLEIALHHTSGILGANQEMAILGLPLGRGNSLGVSLNYADDGAFEGRDINGAPTADFSSRAYGANVGWGFNASDGLSLGLAIKANRQDLAGTGYNGVAGDLGLLWTKGPGLTLGAAYTNIGPDVEGKPLAQGLRLGLSSYLNKCSDYEWLIALSGESLTRGENSVHLGLEHTLFQTLSLRAGYGMDVPSSAAAGLLGWTFGGGVLLGKLSVDYAYVPLAELGSMQRVSLTYNFGQRCGLTSSAKSAAPIETLLAFSDNDFKRVTPGGEDEVLTSAAEGRLHQGLSAVSGVAGAFLTVNGTTALMLNPNGNKNGPELREIGGRRAKLVLAYLKEKMSGARFTSVTTDGLEKGTPARIFKVVLR